MASACDCCSLHWNPPPVGKDELISVALPKGSGTLTSTPAMSRALILTLAIAFSVAPTLDNELFNQFMQAY